MLQRREAIVRMGAGALLAGLVGIPRSGSTGEPGDEQGPGLPRIDRPIRFDTPEADRILDRLQVFPPDNPWNEDISDWSLHPNSPNLIASIGAGKPFRYNPDM